MEPVADRLMADTLELQKRVGDPDDPAQQDGGRRRRPDRGSGRDQDQRRGGSLQRHRSVGLPGQCGWRPENLRSAAPAHRQAKCRTGFACRRRILPRSTRCLPDIASGDGKFQNYEQARRRPTTMPSRAPSRRWQRICRSCGEPSGSIETTHDDTMRIRNRADPPVKPHAVLRRPSRGAGRADAPGPDGRAWRGRRHRGTRRNARGGSRRLPGRPGE